MLLHVTTFQKFVASLYVPVTVTFPSAVALADIVTCLPLMLRIVVSAGIPVPVTATPGNQPSVLTTPRTGEPFVTVVVVLATAVVAGSVTRALLSCFPAATAPP